MTLSEKIIAKINLYNTKVLDACHSIFGMSGDAYIKKCQAEFAAKRIELDKNNGA